MTRRVAACAALCLALTGALAFAQPLTQGPFSLDTEQLVLRDVNGQLQLEATGGVTFRQTGATVQAKGATMRLARPGGSAVGTAVIPVELRVTGGVSLRESDGNAASAGQAIYTFGTETLQLIGGVRREQSPHTIRADRASMSGEGTAIHAEGNVQASLVGLKVLEQGTPGITTVSANTLDWNAATSTVTALGTPVQVQQDDLTLRAPTLSFATRNEVLQSLKAQGGLVLEGDLEGKGERSRIEADSATYDPASGKLLLTGPVTWTRGASQVKAQSAEVRISTPRQVRLIGMQGSFELETPSP